MNENYEIIARAACEFAAEVPLPTLHIVARMLDDSASLETAKRRLVELAHPHCRSLADALLTQCESLIPEPTPQTISLVLLTAGMGEKVHREEQSVELVWTGPDAGVVAFRRTEQVILQVLDCAKQHITLVSYAVYSIPNIQQALVRAAERGVKIRIIVETPDKLTGQNEYSTLQALGPEIADCCTVYYWPQEKRQAREDKVGILHVKCAVADGKRLFLSSANLTEYAFTINMELGVLVTGGPLPGQVEENFQRLVEIGLVQRV